MSALEMDPLIGRDAALRELMARLSSHRLVTLTGPGGTGKTRLAEALVDASRVDREAVLLDLSTVTSGDELALALTSSLQIPVEGDAEAALHAWARSGPRLVALDNLEQIRGAAAPIGRLLAAAPDLRLLATSRGPIGIKGEHEFPLGPLSLPAADTPEAVEESPAGMLFLERARALGRLTEPLALDAAADIARLCRRLDGLPLAIELAAARTRILSPGAILRRLGDRDLDVLRRRDGTERHRSLAAVLEWSLALMTDDERAALGAAAVCAGTFDLELIGSIVPGLDPVDTLDALVAHGVVVVDEEVDGEPRFRLLETVRLGTLPTLQDEESLRDRHAAAVAKSVHEWSLEIEGPGLRRALARLDAARLSIEAAIDWLAERAPAQAARLVWDAAGYLIVRDAIPRAIAWLEALLPRLADDDEGRAIALGGLVRLHGQAGAEDELLALGPEALELGRRVGNTGVQYEVLIRLLVAGDDSGHRGDREALTRQIAALSPTNPRELFLSLVPSTWIEADYETERAASQAALDRLKEAGALRPMSIIRSNMGADALRVGRLADAVAFGDEAAAMARAMGDAFSEAFPLGTSAVAAAELGQWAEAEARHRRTAVLARAVGTRSMLMVFLREAGAIASIAGHPRDAAWLYGAAERAFEPTSLADPTLERVSGTARQWRRVRSALTPVEWELARREGHQATLDEAMEVALGVFVDAPANAAKPADRIQHGTLTPREVEILTLVGEGRSDGEIAGRLFISPKTASVHVANVKAKLGASSRLDVALRARELGVVGARA